MKDWDLMPTLAAASAGGKPAGAAAEVGLFFRGRYKFWAIAAILFLAFCSMLAGTVTLKWSASNLNGISENSLSDDLDVLELEEREKVVRRMWDVYSNIRRIRLPRFWKDAFEAAYEELKSDNGKVRDAALTEIARMSMRMTGLDPPPRQTQDSKTGINQTYTRGTANSSSLEAR